MKIEEYSSPLPLAYTNQVIEKSNLLLRANMYEAQNRFDEAAELFAEAATLEAELAQVARGFDRIDVELIHLISELSCWAAAGDTYRALTQGEQILTLSHLTSAQRSHIQTFLEEVSQRRRDWMQSWTYREVTSA